MNRQNRFWTGTVALIGTLVLILDAKTALTGAREGVDVCLKTVIPSLFPFFVLSALIRNTFMGKPIKALGPMCRLCGIPSGAESLLLLGFLGGYPVGAQGVYEAYETGSLTKRDAQRLLAFCSNAGPAFIFGMVGGQFSHAFTPWVIWGIQIISALTVGVITAPKAVGSCCLKTAQHKTFPQILEESIKTTANVCGWVVIFRVLITFSKRWFLWLLPQELQTALISVLELSNGCLALQNVSSEGIRYLISTTSLSFGGICVAMQTASVTRDLGTGLYLPGKVMQTALSFLLAVATQPLLLTDQLRWSFSPVAAIPAISAGAICFRIMRKNKKTVAILC